MRPRHFKDTEIPASQFAGSSKPAAFAIGFMTVAFIIAAGASSPLFAEPGIVLAQTTVPLRGLQDDALSRLPTAQELLRRQQSQQLNTLSTRQSIEQSERRQHLERMHQQSTTCADPNNPACTAPPAAK